MRYFPISLYKKNQIGEDKLHNPIYEEVFYGDFDARKSVWTAEEVNSDVRGITKSTQKVLTSAPYDLLIVTDTVVFKDKKYIVEDFRGEEEDRWRLLALKAYGK